MANKRIRIRVKTDEGLSVHCVSHDGNYDTLCSIDASDRSLGHLGTIPVAINTKIDCVTCKNIFKTATAEASLATLVAQQEAMREALEMPIGHAEWWGDWPVSDLYPAHQAERIIKRRLAALAMQKKGGKA